MKRNMKTAAATIGLAVAGILSIGELVPSSALSASAQAATTAQRAVFTIENMTCALCPVTVKKAMEGVAGVKSVAIDFDAKTATVTFDPSKATVAAIAQASTNAGYPAHATKS
ncbi:heavy-metal-associated domain-containing protein [Ferrovibrio xuzhouensis]|uniref:Heavy-metal-associated domain-containing protein n=1 Tax=Ferrovibrio xuzhouensis TaxID=1576914 RepID=A0ABV7VHX7_9PROT